MLAALGVVGFMGASMAVFGGTNTGAVVGPEQAFDTRSEGPRCASPDRGGSRAWMSSAYVYPERGRSTPLH